jgi:hypothetical protein
MPVKNGWKQEMQRDLERWRNGIGDALDLQGTAVLRVAREDGILHGGNEKGTLNSGGVTYSYQYWVETPQTNRYYQRKPRYSSKKKKMVHYKPRKIYSQTEYMSRSGNLENSLTPSGGWSQGAGGEATMQTRGECKITRHSYQGKSWIKFSFTGKAAGALAGGDSKQSRNTVTVISDQNGNPIHTQATRGRRRIMELAANKVARNFVAYMKKSMQKQTAGRKS